MKNVGGPWIENCSKPTDFRENILTDFQKTGRLNLNFLNFWKNEIKSSN
jgi:hypothetical protein